MRAGADELLRDREWAGARRPDLVIAGLVYEPGLTGAWRMRSEPWEEIRTALGEVQADGGRRLRLENHKTSLLYQVAKLPNDEDGGVERRLLASVLVRGKISQTNAVVVKVVWFDAGQKPIDGVGQVRMPAGYWTEGQRVVFPVVRPEGAVYAGLFINVLHQQRGDWVELFMPSLAWGD